MELPNRTEVDATATVVSARKTNAKVNFDPILDLELTIVPAGMPPYAITVRRMITNLHIAKVQPGSTLLAKVDLGDPASVRLDLVNS